MTLQKFANTRSWKNGIWDYQSKCGPRSSKLPPYRFP